MNSKATFILFLSLVPALSFSGDKGADKLPVGDPQPAATGWTNKQAGLGAFVIAIGTACAVRGFEYLTRQEKPKTGESELLKLTKAVREQSSKNCKKTIDADISDVRERINNTKKEIALLENREETARQTSEQNTSHANDLKTEKKDLIKILELQQNELTQKLTDKKKQELIVVSGGTILTGAGISPTPTDETSIDTNSNSSTLNLDQATKSEEEEEEELDLAALNQEENSDLTTLNNE